jgi:transcription termination factor rho
MMKDKLETLTILQLRELAKHEGLKKFTALNKQDLVSLLVKHYEAKVEEVLEEENNIDAPKTLYKEEPIQHTVKKQQNDEKIPVEMRELDSGIIAHGILEVMPDGFGFIRCENFLPGDNDVYVAPSQIKRFKLKTGDIISGSRRVKASAEKFAALLYVQTVNGYRVSELEHRPNFEDLTPIFPDKRIPLSNYPNTPTSMRVMDIISPIGKGQRGMIVSPPKAGKTTLLKEVAKAVLRNEPDMNIIILLIDERPEEVTDIKEAITGEQVEVIYSTFDELPERHKRVSEMVIERAKRLVEHGKDVIILLDSITRLARAYNLTIASSGRTLSGGLDTAALHMPKRFFGAARNTREGGSLTILATALVDTGSRMDDIVYEEFKGTGNMELVLDRKLSEKRIFPSIDILKSGTRRDDLLLSPAEQEALRIIKKSTNSNKAEESAERVISLFADTNNNKEFVEHIIKRQTV